MKRRYEMTYKQLFLSLIIIFAMCDASHAGTEVGYVNILNGVEPGEAFSIERQGETIIPKSAYTDLEEGDRVKFSNHQAMLLFVPDDASCPEVEIREDFTASGCPVSGKSLVEVGYDLARNEFLAAPLEQVAMAGTRGADSTRAFTLLPEALKIYIQDNDLLLSPSLQKMPYTSLVTTPQQAEVELRVDGGEVRLSGFAQNLRFRLPEESIKLRQCLLGFINFKAMLQLQAPSPWPQVEWSIAVFSESSPGNWVLARNITVDRDKLEEVAAESSKLTFALNNLSDKTYYAYIVNFTDAGQVQPVIASADLHNPQGNKLSPGGMSLSWPQLQLELGAPVEYIRLILSENPLDLSTLTQDSFSDVNVQQIKRIRPAPPNTWHSRLAVFSRNGQ
jgi:hypothetical protein